MKRYIFIFILTTHTLLCFQQNNEKKWNFPVKPGTNEWNNLKSEQERINAMQIPEELLTIMSAEELLDACVNFPLFGYYSAFNTPQVGFEIMFSRFNIFNKLCEKDSIGQYLVKVYEDAEMDGWKHMGNKFDGSYWTLKLSYIEYLIAQKEVVSRLEQKDKAELLKIAKAKLTQKLAHQSFNSISGISPSLLLISRILYSDKVLYDSLLLKGEKNIQYLLETGLLNNTEIIDEILNLTVLYLGQ